MNRFLLILILLFLSFTYNSVQQPPPSGWYQQFIPDLGGAQLSDITFVDSLIGYAVTPYVQQYDTAYIIKTTNGGDNWFIIRTDVQEYSGFNRIIFFNKDTGYVAGVLTIERTTNGGQNWTIINTPYLTEKVDMFVLNKDTIWFTDDHSLSGGIFRTTNGGITWTNQWNWFSNPEKIYMYDRNLGFFSRLSQLYRTTNSGEKLDFCRWCRCIY